jgi:hypothetical protein
VSREEERRRAEEERGAGSVEDRLAQALALAIIDLEKTSTVRSGEVFEHNPFYLDQALRDYARTLASKPGKIVTDEMKRALDLGEIAG